MIDIDSLLSEQYCYLTTMGRVTGRAHTIEIWFAAQTGSLTLYLLSGGREKADWVKNIRANPAVEVRIETSLFKGLGRLVSSAEEDKLARSLVVKKYYGRDEVSTSGWEAESLAVAIDLSDE